MQHVKPAETDAERRARLTFETKIRICRAKIQHNAPDADRCRRWLESKGVAS